MSQGKITGALVGLFIVATSAGTVAAWNYSAQSVPLFAESAAVAVDSRLQTSESRTQTNAEAKTDRLPRSPIAPIVELAAAAPPAAREPAPAAMSYAVAALSSTPAEPPKPRRPLPAERPRAEPKGLLDDGQIASLRTRLRLTPAQQEFWPAVEVTLREVVREHARKNRKTAAQGIATPIDVNSPEVQHLIAAATPLIMRLSEEQKREVRQLARIIGLETVAARI